MTSSLFWQLLEAETVCAIFQDNTPLCCDVTERVVQHFVHCIETRGRHVQYLKFLQTIVKSEGNYIRKCQDLVMAEVSGHRYHLARRTSMQKYLVYNKECCYESRLASSEYKNWLQANWL